MNTVERAHNRRYQREFWPAMAGYAIVLALTLVLVDGDSASPWNVVWMLAPVIPSLFVVRAVHHWITSVDEYQRKVQVESLAVAFALSMVAALTVGFLDVDLPFRAGGWIIYSIGMLGWGITSAVKSTA